MSIHTTFFFEIADVHLLINN
jgi:hypothetical protein